MRKRVNVHYLTGTDREGLKLRADQVWLKMYVYTPGNTKAFAVSFGETSLPIATRFFLSIESAYKLDERTTKTKPASPDAKLTDRSTTDSTPSATLFTSPLLISMVTRLPS